MANPNFNSKRAEFAKHIWILVAGMPRRHLRLRGPLKAKHVSLKVCQWLGKMLSGSYKCTVSRFFVSLVKAHLKSFWWIFWVPQLPIKLIASLATCHVHLLIVTLLFGILTASEGRVQNTAVMECWKSPGGEFCCYQSLGSMLRGLMCAATVCSHCM